MPTAEEQALSILVAERDRLSSLIALMQKNLGKSGRNVTSTTGPRRGQRKFTAKQRREKSQQMKALWKKRKAEAASKKKTATKG